jgi:hypothetical protein
MAEPRKYIPKCNARSRQSPFGEVLTIGFDVKELIAFAEANKNERGFLNVCVVPRREPNEFATHSVYLDEFKPTRGTGQQRPARQSAPSAPANDAPPSDDSGDQVPF